MVFDSHAEFIGIRPLRPTNGRPGVPKTICGYDDVVEHDGKRLHCASPFALSKLIFDLGDDIVTLGGVEEFKRHQDHSERIGNLIGLASNESGGHVEPTIRGDLGIGGDASETARNEAKVVRGCEFDCRHIKRLRCLLPFGERFPHLHVVRGEDRVASGACRHADCILGPSRVAVNRLIIVAIGRDNQIRQAFLDSRCLRRRRRMRIAWRRINRHACTADFVRCIDAGFRNTAVRIKTAVRPCVRTRLHPAGRHNIPRRVAACSQSYLVRGNTFNNRCRCLWQRHESERPRRHLIAINIRRRNRDGVFGIGGKAGR